MTTSFSFSRLTQLIRKHWVENSRLYIFSVLALLGLQGLVFAFWIGTAGNQYLEHTAYMIFLTGIFLAGSIFASMAFSMLGEKPRASYWLSFPASHLEKLITVIFYATVVFTLIYSACFFVVKSAADLYIDGLIERFPGRYSYKQVDFSDGFGDVFWASIYGFFAVQAFYLMGAVYFTRYSFVVTTIIGAIAIFLYVYYISNLSDGFFSHPYHWEGFRVAVHDDAPTQASTYRSYELGSTIKDVAMFVIKYAWAPLFWVVTWYRLREKQVQ